MPVSWIKCESSIVIRVFNFAQLWCQLQFALLMYIKWSGKISLMMYYLKVFSEWLTRQLFSELSKKREWSNQILCFKEISDLMKRVRQGLLYNLTSKRNQRNFEIRGALNLKECEALGIAYIQLLVVVYFICKRQQEMKHNLLRTYFHSKDFHMRA